jgi:hypothetical protein
MRMGWKMSIAPRTNKDISLSPGSAAMSALKDVKREHMKKEIRELEARIKELRRLMEFFEIFQQDDEVGQALAEVEAELEKFRFK